MELLSGYSIKKVALEEHFAATAEVATTLTFFSGWKISKNSRPEAILSLFFPLRLWPTTTEAARSVACTTAAERSRLSLLFALSVCVPSKVVFVLQRRQLWEVSPKVGTLHFSFFDTAKMKQRVTKAV